LQTVYNYAPISILLGVVSCQSW